jgi:tRNA (guanine-N7-)-methyltransferase
MFGPVKIRRRFLSHEVRRDLVIFNREYSMPPSFPRKIRSFVCRDGRMTEAQQTAYNKGWPTFGLTQEQGLLNFEGIFQRNAPCILEIGFGSGQSLLAMAKAHPDINFIGIEMHLPGVSSLLLGMQQGQITNIRIFNADAVEVLSKNIPKNSLDAVQIFFPDPWPKRRHHKRRLVQPKFVQELQKYLKRNGTLHLATDWQDYAQHMMKVLTANTSLINAAGPLKFASRSEHRPIMTKYEQRGMKNGREIWELNFVCS